MTKTSPSSQERTRLLANKVLETFDQLITTIKCPATKARLVEKAAVARAKANKVNP